MTESDYRWLTNDNLPGQTIRVVAGSEWHYAQGGWHETDPVLELTAADIEAVDADEQPELEYAADAKDVNQPAAELADNEQEPGPQPPAQEES